MPIYTDWIQQAWHWLSSNGSTILDGTRTVIDLLLVWLLLYYLMLLLRRNMRTMQIFKGVLLVLFIKFVSNVFSLKMVSWLVDLILSWGVVAIIIVFQPEIRQMLERLGQTRVLNSVVSLSSDEKERVAAEVASAVRQMSESHTGALITFEKEQSLMDYIASGVDINADIKADLLLTIFMEGTRLHDGAVIIQGNKIRCASAFFPQTHRELSPKFGARHRAALGLSEVSDALTIVVSEETGTVSFAKQSRLEVISLTNLKERLLEELTPAFGGEGSE